MLKIVPSLKELRDALYSREFRQYLCNVTGSGHVSGKKTDMAINVYTSGCHLLCHDDVIGSRRISYILYLTDPETPWKEEWGGALRLYPTKTVTSVDGAKVMLPSADHSKSIPPAFNQLSFFAVQPGQSFHDVEEVYADEDLEPGKDQPDRVRLAISGWYHVPQEGEEGYSDNNEDDMVNKSSLAQLGGGGQEHDRPQKSMLLYSSKDLQETPKSQAAESGLDFSESDLEFLLQFIAPTYLTPDALSEVSATFEEECSIVLDKFLSNKFSDRLREYIQSAESNPKPSRAADWEVACPPHKCRYKYQRALSSDHFSPIQELLQQLIPSSAFRKWFYAATGYILKSHDLVARRFRRGKDYTLAQSYEEDEPRVEICLSITPTMGWGDESAEAEIDPPTEAGSNEASKPEVNGTTEKRDVGGYLVYMAGDEDDSDDEASNHGVEIPADMSTGGRATRGKKPKADPAVYQAREDEDDGMLFSMPAGWNKLGIVLRDKGTMRFVKYVSRSAKGDRWDVFGELEIEDNDEDDNEDNPDDETRGVENARDYSENENVPESDHSDSSTDD